MEDKKVINWRDEIIKLFPDKLTKVLKENSKWCERCNGLGLIRESNYISVCRNCRGEGQIKLCENGCCKDRIKPYTVCKECKEREWIEENNKREQEKFDKANKIKFSEYKGKFFGNNDEIVDSDVFEEELYEMWRDNDDIERYVFGVAKYRNIDINIFDIISDICEDDGYEDQYSFFDKNGLDDIQDKIDNWIEEQGDTAYCYEYDYDTVVLLDELVEQFKEEEWDY